MTEQLTHHTFCRICPVLCGLVVTTEDDRVVDVRGDRDHPMSRGYCCPKGRASGAFHHHPQRLDGPRLGATPTSWDAVLGDLAARLRRIVDEHGPDAVGVYFGTWSWMDALGRQRAEAILRHLGSRSRYSAVTVDAIARLTVAELVGGFGGLLPAIDPDSAGLTVLIGTNPVVSHGHAGALVDPVTTLRRIATRAGLWVLDPRRTESARLATHHLPVLPGGDVAVLAAVVRELLRDGADGEYLAAHAHGVDTLTRAVEPWTMARAAARAQLPVEDIESLVEAIRRAKRVTVVTGTGATMSADANVIEWLAWAIQIITGSFEDAHGAWFNPGVFVRLDQTTRPAAPPEGRTFAGAPSRPELPGRFGERPCAALADEIDAGNIRALFVFGGDPLTSLPDSTRLARSFAHLEVLAVADVLESVTVATATHVLAVAGQFERADVNWFTDRFASSICAQRTDAVLQPARDRRTQFDVLQDLGARLGLAADDGAIERMTERVPALGTQRVVIAEPARVRGWVHERVLPDGRWRVAPAPLVQQLSMLESTTTEKTLLAIPRRAVRRMNSSLRDIGRGGEDAALWVNPASAGSFRDGDVVRLRSARGAMTGRLRVTTDIAPGAISVPHGLSPQNVNQLTSTEPGEVDALTGMITQSGFAVTLEHLHVANAGATS